MKCHRIELPGGGSVTRSTASFTGAELHGCLIVSTALIKETAEENTWQVTLVRMPRKRDVSPP